MGALTRVITRTMTRQETRTVTRSPAAVVGTPFTSIPGVGAISTWGGSPSTLAFRTTLNSYINYRRATVPSARAVTKYVGQSAAGSSTGGGGAGTVASPWLVRTMADFRTLYAANDAADMRWCLRRGDYFYSANSNTDQGYVSAHDSITLDSYSDPLQPSSQMPCMLGFKAPYSPGALEAAGGDYYTVIEPNAVYWVRNRVSGGNYESFTTKLYARYTSAVDVIANEGGWYWAAGVLHVRLYADHSTSDLEAIVATGPGLNAKNFQSFRGSDLIVDGWGWGGGDVGVGSVRSEPIDTNEHYFSNIKSRWSTHHNIHRLTTSGTGGIVTFDDCEAGAGVHTTSSSDAFLGFCSAGGHETLVYNCSAPIGPLQSKGASDLRAMYQGTPIYGHTTTGTVGLFMVVGFDSTSAHAQTRYGAIPSVGDCPTPSSRSDWTQYRSFFIDCVGLTHTGIECSPTKFGWYSGCKYKFLPLVPAANAYIITGGTVPFNHIMDDCDLEIELSGVWTGKYLAVFIDQISDANCDWYNSRFRITPGTGATMGGNDFVNMKFNATGMGNMGLYNCVISNETGKVSQSQLRIGNANPSSPGPGGSNKTAFYGWQAAHYASASSPIVPAAAPSYTDAAGVNSELATASGALPTGVAVQRDILGMTRPSSSYSVGPIEKNPV